MEMTSRSQKELETSYKKLNLTQKKYKEDYEKELVMLRLKAEQST